MNGHLVKRGKTWSIVLELNNDESGERRQKWISFRGKLQQAAAAKSRFAPYPEALVSIRDSGLGR
jgi:hypothetical protein